MLFATAVGLAACGSTDSSTANPPATTTPVTEPGTSSPPDPESETTATPESSERLIDGARVTLTTTPCDEITDSLTAICGTAAVPADWTDPQGQTLDLTYVVLPAAGGESDGTVIPFMGGPGESITAQIDILAPLADALPDRDVLVVDVRGPGRSAALTCAVLDSATEFTFGTAQPRDTGRCAEQIGDTRNHYTTAATAIDIEAVRRALDLEPPSLIGFSYGTFLAQTYTTLFPNDVQATVLDGAFPIEQTGWGTDIPTSFAAVLDLRCARTSRCPEGADAVAADIKAVAASLAEAPVEVPGAQQQLSEGAFAGIVQFALQDAEMADFVATMDTAANGDYAALTQVAAESFATPPVGPTSYSPALFSAIACNDYVTPFDMGDTNADRADELAERLASLPDDEFGWFSKQGWVDSGWEEGDMCLQWPTPDVPAELRVPRNVDRPAVPVLVVNGDIDLQTPLIGARTVASIYPNSVLVTVPNAGHVALPVSECAARTEIGFLTNPVLPSPDACSNEPVTG